MKLLILILSLLLIFASCKKENRFDCFTGSGKIITIEYSPEKFKTVELKDNFKVFLHQDTCCKVTITVGEKILPYISYEVIDNSLIIDNRIKCKWARKYNDIEVHIYTDSLEKIILNGDCDVFSADTIKARSFTLDMYESISKTDITLDCEQLDVLIHAATGDYKFNGYADKSYFYCHGNAYIFAGDLITSECSVLNISTGDFYVRPEVSLFAYILSSGNVYYYGNPEIHLDTKSKGGELIKMD
jgi:hypothetical protein